jgi:hypothetical protein
MSKQLRWACGNTGVHFSLAIPVLFLSLAAKPGPSASDVLRRAFDSQFKNHVELVQLTATPSDPGSKIFKLYIDPKVGAHVNILSPTVLSNTRSVDNRRELKIFYPSQNEIVVQKSPQVFKLPLDKRMKLVERNFSLSLKDDGAKVAGRTVYVVYLKAKNAGVGDRQLCVDKEKGNILRSILIEERSNFVLLETLVANFSVPYKKGEFDLPKSAQVSKKWGPVDLAKFKDANKKLGFAPRVPGTLPKGFEITHKQIVGQEKKPIMAFRLSDGMNTITVFQWNPKLFGGESPFQNVPTKSDVYGIRYYAEGDAPKAVQSDIVDTFRIR